MRAIALEAQVLPELSPLDVVRAAAAAGFAHAGVWIGVARWTRGQTAEVRRAFVDGGIAPLDAEVLRIGAPVTDDQLRTIDIAADIGVPNIVAIGVDADAGAVVVGLVRLAEHAEPLGVRIVLEFGMFSAVGTLADALSIVEAAGPTIGILPDPLHLARSGGTAAQLAAVPADRIAFAQICDGGDGPATPSAEALLDEARFDRRNLGEGTLPLRDYVRALPGGVPISNEVRSRQIARLWPDPWDRAVMLAGRTRACIDEWETEP